MNYPTAEGKLNPEEIKIATLVTLGERFNSINRAVFTPG